MYILRQGGIVQFADGTVERFGDVDEDARALRCPGTGPGGEGWLLPWSSCAATWEVRGRFEESAR